MWSLNSQRGTRTSGPKNFQPSAKKDFFNTIGTFRTCRGADLIPLKRRQHRPLANGLHGKNLAQSETLCTWRKFFARNLGGLIHARTRVPEQLLGGRGSDT